MPNRVARPRRAAGSGVFFYGFIVEPYLFARCIGDALQIFGLIRSDISIICPIVKNIIEIARYGNIV